MNPFHTDLLAGIPDELPAPMPHDESVSHAPVRRLLLTPDEQRLAVRNALRYFSPTLHAVLAPEFADELRKYGRIYMHRYRPTYAMHARPIADYPARSQQAAAIMLMIQNNLDPAVAQHPHELITYGGNGAVFQNWAQYRLAMQYLATMTDEQTLVMNSGHPLGVFPSHADAPRVVVSNGMMIPNYSQPDDWERGNALGVTQYGQMTAGSYMYIGPQGIVHGTTITLLGAARRKAPGTNTLRGKLFVSSGLGGMSGAQAKAAVIAGAVGVIAEVNPQAVAKRQAQGWVDEACTDLDVLCARIAALQAAGVARSLAYQGNIVELWEGLAARGIAVDIGSDQTSLHNPWAGGYYPAGLSFAVAQQLMVDDPAAFRAAVQDSLRRQVAAINQLAQRGMYFFDYGNAFLLEAQRANADVLTDAGALRYASYVQDIMGPLCFDYGFGPFRWVCTSNDPADLAASDAIAANVIRAQAAAAPADIQLQLADNLRWIEAAHGHNLVVGSQARILYADANGRVAIAVALNAAIRTGTISAPIVIGRDHHDVSGTDSPYRETANITDGSQWTADMAVQNFVGDAMRGATWVSLHNGGGVGWGEAINGGFGLVIDGSDAAERRIRSMMAWDVWNGLARRNWARNPGAMTAMERAMAGEPHLRITVPHLVNETLLEPIS